MASDTDSEKNDESDLALAWSGRWTLSYRILAVNVLTIVLIALAVVYLDAYRNRLEKERLRQVAEEASLAATSIMAVAPPRREALLAALSKSTDSRLRLYSPEGMLRLDSWRITGPTYRLRDPTTQAWNKDAARALDRLFNTLVGEESRDDFVEPAADRADEWAEVRAAREFRLLAIDHAHVVQRGIDERCRRDRGARGVVLAGFGEAEVDLLRRREIRREHDIEQAALALREHGRHVRDRLAERAVRRHATQATWAFGNQERAVGHQCDRPGMVEPLRDRLHAHGARRCRRTRRCAGRSAAGRRGVACGRLLRAASETRQATHCREHHHRLACHADLRGKRAAG